MPAVPGRPGARFPATGDGAPARAGSAAGACDRPDGRI